MFNLILKDVTVTKKTNIILVVYAVILSVIGLKMPEASGFLYIMSIFMIAYITILTANSYDEKYKFHISLNSLPINKKDIVLSKYLSLVVYVIFYSMVVILLTNILYSLGFKSSGRAATIWDLIVSFNILGIFYSIYYPLYYKFEGSKLRIFSFILYILVIVSPGYVVKLIKTTNGQHILYLLSKINNINTLHLSFFVVVLIIMFISIQISTKIYSNKEF
ncbi:ABC-2 transporter permease [Clostridium ganghwense]|uniref:ABC-2 transporter permease n=1 Tax=Clostridium ganghwense TaxID=312089 RepID=A0ABT4CRN8_9CLOT|nr:ABC-2 transporter permease [Clostridium ganghwense]MCY6370886.1 ABC-2 transporter permease [Clostridium ganghwense]